MKQKQAMCLVISSIFLSFEQQETHASMAKPGCQEKCGNITIPYPFGIGGGCYLDSTFELGCNYVAEEEYGSPLFFSNGFSILNMSLEYVRVGIGAEISCYDESGTGSVQVASFLLDQRLSFPYAQNKFVGIGCDIFAYISDNGGNNYTSGCTALCDESSPVVGLSGGTCSGVGCCESTIPADITDFDLQIHSINTVNKSWTTKPCSIAFVAEKNFSGFMINISDTSLDRSYDSVPALLTWVVHNTSCEDAYKNENYACGPNSTCIDYNGKGYQCQCLHGYQGNPYLPTGCQDIDECRDPVNNLCQNGATCVNVPGYYLCICPPGYHDDRHEPRCIREHWRWQLAEHILLGVGIAAGAIIVSAFAIWLYRIFEKRKKDEIKQKYFRRNGGLLLQREISCSKVGVIQTKLFSTEEMEKATENFSSSRVLGKGGQGTVYKGMLPDGIIVAVKKANIIDNDQVVRFINEVFILTQINHRNIVKLLGCCLEYEVPLLVYEYVSNGTLALHLHGEGHASTLSWDTRLVIAAETVVLKGGQKEEICVVAKLAKRCLKLKAKKRPSMKEVAADLDRLRRIHE
ncbi:hypothetical protein RJ639_017857 [Escallonia herrerae]|uniref:Uncharacterized protein n=1 Tax=Escallonia herrerae TaxID=1293975 RepID=A0AA88VH04_9ASTE|nr:hypothetical protein RJ639_017857 [Escallonia herrerae]